MKMPPQVKFIFSASFSFFYILAVSTPGIRACPGLCLFQVFFIWAVLNVHTPFFSLADIKTDGRSDLLSTVRRIKTWPHIWGCLLAAPLTTIFYERYIHSLHNYSIKTDILLSAFFYSSYGIIHLFLKACLQNNVFKRVVAGSRHLPETNAGLKIPDQHRTAFLYPVKAGEKETIATAISNLETAALDFSEEEDNVLLFYCSDTDDEALILEEIRLIRDLQMRQGGGRFYYLHRNYCFGYKWGNIYDALCFLQIKSFYRKKNDKFQEASYKDARVYGVPDHLKDAFKPGCEGILGDVDRLMGRGFVFKHAVISDYDTLWGRGQADKIVRKAMHPDNQSYDIIFPKVSLLLGWVRDKNGPFFHFPATGALCALQPLYGRSKFVGKGVFLDIDRYIEYIESGPMPVDILGHDNFETMGFRKSGGGAAIACDVQMYEPFEKSLVASFRNSSRWAFGDFQFFFVYIPWLKALRSFINKNRVEIKARAFDLSYEQKNIISFAWDGLFFYPFFIFCIVLFIFSTRTLLLNNIPFEINVVYLYCLYRIIDAVLAAQWLYRITLTRSEGGKSFLAVLHIILSVPLEIAHWAQKLISSFTSNLAGKGFLWVGSISKHEQSTSSDLILYCREQMSFIVIFYGVIGLLLGWYYLAIFFISQGGCSILAYMRAIFNGYQFPVENE